MSQSSPAFRTVLTLTALLVGASQATAQKVVFDRVSGFRMTYIGQRWPLSARVVDNNRRPIPGAALSFRVEDPTIASVTPRGEVVSRKAGRTYVWAIAQKDSASMIVLVEPRAARFSFSPSVLRLDALGVRMPLKIQISDAAGNPLPDATTNTSRCRSLNERIVGYVPTGEVVANANGSTYIRCTDRLIADSVRVDVQQRPARATIASALDNASKTVGDTFTVRVTASDRSQKPIVDPRPTWASLTPAVAVVDPLTGKARLIGPGSARIVASVGDVADTVTVSVSASAFSFGGLPGAADTATEEKKATTQAPRMQFGQTFVTEGDTNRLAITVLDSLGRAIPNPRLTLRSSDSTVLAVLDSQSVEARKRGSAWIYATHGSLVDSAFLSVNLKVVPSAADSALFAADSTAPLKLPTIDSTSARELYKKQREEVLARLLEESTYGRTTSGRFVSGIGLVSMAAHSSRTSATAVERRSGLLYGGELTAAPHRRVLLSGIFRTGNLQSPTVDVGEVLKITEAEGGLAFLPFPAIGIRAGYVRRAEATPLATQIWNFPRATILTRFAFVGGAFNTIADFSLLPGATYTATENTGDKPSLISLSGEAGLEYRSGRINAGLTYYVERFNFEEGIRVQQFSALRFRAGFRLAN